jgi:hypothetical protein
MTVHTFRSRPPRPSVQSEEERAWVSFYQRARHNPAIAAEVLTQLDLDPEMKREHLALYLCCRESLRLHEARAARDQHIGQAVRWLVDAVTVRSFAAVRRVFGRTTDVALACLPGGADEPAQSQVRRLAADPAIRAARASFRRRAAATAPAPTPASPPDAPVPPAATSPAVRAVHVS